MGPHKQSCVATFPSLEMGRGFVFVILGLLFVCLAHAERLAEEEALDQQDVSFEESSDVDVPFVQDCVLSAWSDWSPCTKPCGVGTQTKTRTVVVQPQNGGRGCGNLTWTNWCNTFACPIDCTFSAWSEWSACQRCSYQTRTRTTIPAQYGGQRCPRDVPLLQYQLCRTINCRQCIYGPEEAIPDSEFTRGSLYFNKWQRRLLFTPPNTVCPPIEGETQTSPPGGTADGFSVKSFEIKVNLVPEPSPYAESTF
eukprot:TRINITY_DN11838_c0_g1_i1.p1 TRINITY_DN11838_c0_g1~~TRINITY_DN11838_c0_g1_i1.p1  ORF type:complete len:263 (-),score=33.47 TRINITY_DN11838_c0_g1_i1:249-1007(-)